MSIHVMVAIFDADGLTSTEKLVALAYAEHGHDDGREARAGIDRICGYTALSRRTVQSTLQSLVTKRVIEVERQATNKRPTCYRFILTPDGKSLARGAVVAPLGDAGGATDTAGGATDDILGCDSCTQTVNEPLDEPTTSSKTFDEEVISLTTLLADLIEQNGSKRPAVTNKWRNEIRLLRDKDQHSCRQIENMIRWCQADSFWRANILSATKLRAKYDQMRLRALAEDPRTKELEHQEASAAPVDDDWEEELERRRLESAPPPTNFAKTIREQMNGETP